jgi:excisionase family DNA binding protein
VEELMTAEEVAKVLRVSVRRVKEWGRLGRLPRVALSRSVVRFRRDVVERAMREGMDPAGK